MPTKNVFRLHVRIFSHALISTLLIAAMPEDDTPPPDAPRPFDFGQTAGSFPEYLTDGNGIVYFSADGGRGGGHALWRSEAQRRAPLSF